MRSAFRRLELLAGFGVANSTLGTFDGRIEREEIWKRRQSGTIMSVDIGLAQIFNYRPEMSYQVVHNLQVEPC